MARVSVIVSTFDRPALLLEALASIAAQRYRDFEVIVVNDHGTDVAALVEDVARSRFRPAGIPLRYAYRECNCGVAATRNHGLALARGELVAYLDDDDLWHPHHLEALVATLDAHPDCALAYGDAEVCRMEPAEPRANGVPGEAWRCADTRTLAVPFDPEKMRRDDFVVPGGMMHRRALWEAIGPFDETLPISDDWDWLLRAMRVTAFARCPRVVITVRIWPGEANLSSRRDARRFAALAEIERRHGTERLVPKTFWEVAGGDA